MKHIHWNADDNRFWIRADRGRLAAWVRAVADLQTGLAPSPVPRPIYLAAQIPAAVEGFQAHNPR